MTRRPFMTKVRLTSATGSMGWPALKMITIVPSMASCEPADSGRRG